MCGFIRTIESAAGPCIWQRQTYAVMMAFGMAENTSNHGYIAL